MTGKSVVKQNPGRWTCTADGQSFTRQYTMLQHMNEVHGAPYTRINKEERTGTPVYKGET